MGKLKLFLPLILLLQSFVAFSQIHDPVKWQFNARKKSACVYELVFHAKVDKTWHLYSQNIPEGGPVATSFNFNEGEYKLIGKVKEPAAHAFYDSTFSMKLSYHEGEVYFTQEVQLINDKKITITGEVEYMCCDDHQCLPPDVKKFSFEVSGSKDCAGMKMIKASTVGLPGKPEKAIKQGKDSTKVCCESQAQGSSTIVNTAGLNIKKYRFSEKPCASKFINEQKEESYWLLFLLAFGIGIFALITPCMFPMIPMTVTFFMNDAESKRKGRLKALFFGFSIIFIFCLIGTVFSQVFGSEAANLLATHWIPNLIFFIIFIIFAASFFGLFELTLPSSWVTKSDSKADKGGFIGVFFMALTTVLVSFSCTGPFVGTILVESSKGEFIHPLIGMLGFSTAVALPFTLFAFFPSWMRSLPKSGGWLNSVKVVFGFIELALALKFLSVADLTEHWGILDRDIYIGLWIVIFTLMGCYLLGWIKFSHDSEVKHIGVPRLGFIIATFGFVIYLLPGLIGAPLKFLSGFLPPMSTHDFNILQKEERSVDWNIKPKYSDILHAPLGINAFFEYEEGMAVAEQLGKPVLLDFTGLGCTNCRKVEDNVWTDPEVLKMLKEEYVVISLYVDERTIELASYERYTSKVDGKDIHTLAQKNADIEKCWFNSNSQPFYVLMNNEEQLLNNPIDYNTAKSPEEFLKFLKEGKVKYDLNRK
ncbi:MAG: protein-disulfide reductase DsbD family protein [Bacteroidetes bacterium]|nr:protein-disulfide reductase DsbD family protein [Bacteroidota bacterium]